MASEPALQSLVSTSDLFTGCPSPLSWRWQSLATDSLFTIFDFVRGPELLTVVECTCRSWRAASRRGAGWQSFNTSAFRALSRIPCIWLSLMYPRLNRLRHLHCELSYSFRNKWFLPVPPPRFAHCLQSMSLEIQVGDLEDSTAKLSSLGMLLHLQSLRLQICIEIGFAGTMSLPPLPSLTELELQHAYSYRGGIDLLTVEFSAPSLRHLTSETQFRTTWPSEPVLESLKLTAPTRPGDLNSFTEELGGLLAKASRLRSLDCSWCGAMPAPLFHGLHLEQLVLRDCHDLDLKVVALVSSLTDLRLIEHSTDGPSLRHLSTLTRLRRLDLLFDPERLRGWYHDIEALLTALPALRQLSLTAVPALRQSTEHDKEEKEEFDLGFWETLRAHHPRILITEPRRRNNGPSKWRYDSGSGSDIFNLIAKKFR